LEQEVIKIEEIYLKLLKGFKLIKKNLLLLIICSIIGGVLSIAVKPVPNYDANTSIILKNQGENKGILNLASRLGIGGKSAINFDKIKAVGLSRNIFFKLCANKVKINNEYDYIGAHLIKHYKFDEKWKNKPNLVNVNFSKNSQALDTVINTLFLKSNKNIKIEENKEKLVLISVSYQNHDLALEINKVLTTLILDYFERFELDEDFKTKKILQNKLDSINQELISNENQFARLKDESLNTIKSKGLVGLQNQQRKITILNQMFIEVTTQLEMVNFKILDKTSSFEILDQPFPPLKKNSSSLLFYIIGGTILGFLIGMFISIAIVYIKNLHQRVKDLV
jgi:hypothetical protein